MSGAVLICLTTRYFTPPSNFDGPPSTEVMEWMNCGRASRIHAELLVWHGVYHKNARSPAAIQLLGCGYTLATAELKIRGYESGGPNGWDEPVYTSLLGEVRDALLAPLQRKATVS
jgi:hypothetical protein